LNRNCYIRDQQEQHNRRGGLQMLAFELVGLTFFVLFFGALVTNKQSVSR
jgi:hypothetical protein